MINDTNICMGEGGDLNSKFKFLEPNEYEKTVVIEHDEGAFYKGYDNSAIILN